MKRLFWILVICVMVVPVRGEWVVDSKPFGDVNLRGICVLSETDIWVCGYEGLIGHFDGTSWNTVESSTTESLQAISMSSTDEGWAIGSMGTVLHCVAGTWTPQPDVDPQLDFVGIRTFSSSEVYMIGYGFTEGGNIFRWDGTDLNLEFHVSNNLQDIAASSPDNIWVVGTNNTRIYYDGTSWKEETSTLPESIHLRGVTINEFDQPVACGNLTDHWDFGRILTYSDPSWNFDYEEITDALLLSISIQETVGFAVGEKGCILENSIFGWNRITSPTTKQINEVKLLDMSQGWAVSISGEILHYMQTAIDLVVSPEIAHAGESFEVSYHLMNPGPARSGDLFIFLDVYGSFYFAPSWSGEVGFEPISLPADYRTTETLFSFEWPDVPGTQDYVTFWAAIVSGGELVCYDNEQFRWE